MKKIIYFKTKPFKHQLESLKFHVSKDRTGDWSDCGTGKTWVAINKINGLIESNKIKSCLVICPNSVMKSWGDEIRLHSDLTFCILKGSLYDKIEMLKKNRHIFVCSFDSIAGKVTKHGSTKGQLLQILLLKKFGMIVADEVSLLGNRQTNRVRSISALCDTISKVLFLSGTLVTNEPQNILTVYRLLNKKVFGSNFFESRAKYFSNIGYYYPNWVLRTDKLGEFRDRIYSIAVRLKKEECLDLPDKVDQMRYEGMSKEQFGYYSKIARDLLQSIETPKGNIDINSAMTKIIKLSQITSGFMYTPGGVYTFDPNPKISLLKDSIEEHPGEKIIIYTTYVEEISLIKDMLDKEKEEYCVLDGSTSNKGGLIDAFLKSNIRFLVCNIGVGGYGLTLNASHVIIYYSTGFSIDKYSQSRDRIHRIGQTKTCFYKHLLIEDTIDEYIYNSLRHNMKVKDMIINGDSRLKDNLLQFMRDI